MKLDTYTLMHTHTHMHTFTHIFIYTQLCCLWFIINSIKIEWFLKKRLEI